MATIEKNNKIQGISMNGNVLDTSAFLRQKAEEVLKKRNSRSNSQNYIAESLRLIHELEVHQVELEMQNEELTLMNAEKDLLFSILAHDLRGPFSAFLGLTEIMAEQVSFLEPDDMKELALSLWKSAANVYLLVENLLEWSRMQRGLIEFMPDNLSLSEVIMESTETLADMSSHKDLKIQIQVPDDIYVYADKQMLDSTLRNLLTNAIKFSYHGSAIVVSARGIQHNYIETSVTDSGTGIEADIINDLFNITAKTGRKGTDGESSNGLGLMICKNFIEKNGGRIWVRSQIGKGSTFSFTLPASRAIY